MLYRRLPIGVYGRKPELCQCQWQEHYLVVALTDRDDSPFCIRVTEGWNLARYAARIHTGHVERCGGGGVGN